MLIGIAGGSGSGKSSLAQALAEALPAGETTVIGLDSYHRDLSAEPWKKREQVNFDVPEALDHQMLEQQLRAITRGEVVHAPVYDFERHERSGAARVLEPRPFVIVEGLFALLRDGSHEANCVCD